MDCKNIEQLEKHDINLKASELDHIIWYCNVKGMIQINFKFMKEFYLKKFFPLVVVGTVAIGLCSWGNVIYGLYDIFYGIIDKNFASTIITIHITVASFFLATLALLSSVVSKSYWGISVYSYILDLKQEFFWNLTSN